MIKKGKEPGINQPKYAATSHALRHRDRGFRRSLLFAFTLRHDRVAVPHAAQHAVPHAHVTRAQPLLLRQAAADVPPVLARQEVAGAALVVHAPAAERLAVRAEEAGRARQGERAEAHENARPRVQCLIEKTRKTWQTPGRNRAYQGGLASSSCFATGAPKSYMSP